MKYKSLSLTITQICLGVFVSLYVVKNVVDGADTKTIGSILLFQSLFELNRAISNSSAGAIIKSIIVDRDYKASFFLSFISVIVFSLLYFSISNDILLLACFIFALLGDSVYQYLQVYLIANDQYHRVQTTEIFRVLFRVTFLFITSINSEFKFVLMFTLESFVYAFALTFNRHIIKLSLDFNLDWRETLGLFSQKMSGTLLMRLDGIIFPIIMTGAMLKSYYLVASPIIQFRTLIMTVLGLFSAKMLIKSKDFVQDYTFVITRISILLTLLFPIYSYIFKEILEWVKGDDLPINNYLPFVLFLAVIALIPTPSNNILLLKRKNLEMAKYNWIILSAVVLCWFLIANVTVLTELHALLVLYTFLVLKNWMVLTRVAGTLPSKVALYLLVLQMLFVISSISLEDSFMVVSLLMSLVFISTKGKQLLEYV